MKDPPCTRKVLIDVEFGGDLVDVAGLLGAADPLQLEGPHLTDPAISGDHVAAVTDQRRLEKVRLDHPWLHLLVRGWVPDPNNPIAGPAQRNRLEDPSVAGI